MGKYVQLHFACKIGSQRRDVQALLETKRMEAGRPQEKEKEKKCDQY